MGAKLAQDNRAISKTTIPGFNDLTVVKERGYFAQTLMVTGIFILLFSGYFVCQRILLSAVAQMRLFFLLAFILLIIPHRFTRHKLGMGMFEWFMFNVLAIGPLTFSFIMWTNFFIHGEVEKRKYPLAEVLLLDNNPEVVELTDGWIEYHTALQYWGKIDFQKGTYLEVSKARGIFGMDVITSNMIVP